MRALLGLALLLSACGGAEPAQSVPRGDDESFTDDDGDGDGDAAALVTSDLRLLLAPHASNLVGYYRFDNDIRDSSQAARGLRHQSGTIAFARDGVIGQAVALYDTSMVLPNQPAVEVAYFSFSLWFRSDLVGTANSNSGQTFFKFSCATCGGSPDIDTAYQAAVRNSGQIFVHEEDFEAAPSANDWHHLAGSYGPNRQLVMLDGRLLHDAAGTNAPLQTSGGYLWVGQLWPNVAPLYNPQYLHGGLDELALWSDVLTADELASIYANQRP